jgi:hypothetical protein
LAKEAAVIAGRRLGATTTELSRLLAISSASVSRRFDAATKKLNGDKTLAALVESVVERYRMELNAES